MSRILRLFAPPVFPGDDEKSRLAATLNWILWFFIACWLLGGLSIFFTPNPLQAALAISGLLMIGILGLVLLHRGYIRPLAHFFAFSLWSSTTVVLLVMGGIESPESGSFILVILLAGIFLGRRTVYLYTGLSLISIGMIYYLDTSSQLPPVSLPLNQLSGLMIGSLNLLTAAMLLVVLLNNLRAALKNLQANQTQLTENNRQLEQLTASLEATVTERTRLANTARAEAEAAQQAMRAQFEQAKALADLNESMRGEQDLVQLSQNVLRQLCAALNAQMGAMFVREGDLLRMVGSYAYTRRKQVSNQFRIGEGLVGQAVLEKQAIILTQAPPDYISIASGMLEMIPKNIVAMPFMHDQQVIGVIELAALQDFTPAQTSFLGKALENIAIAFSTAQARTQINTLLQQTQLQAQELRSREEELRSINAELHSKADNLRISQERLRRQQGELETANAELEERTATLQQQSALLDQQNQELKTAQAELEMRASQLAEANKYKSEFLANMSHELRTPLNSLLILARMLANNESGNLTKDQVESAQIIYNSGSDLLSLINDILDLSKVEAGRMTFHFAPLPFENMARNIRAQFDHVAAEKQLDFSVRIAPGTPPEIETDQQRVEQIIKNLLSNAFKFTEKGAVSVLIERTFDMVAIHVSDTGIGMTTEQQQRVFEAFQQADGSTSRKFGGTGLGLTISREMSQRLGGKVDLKSEHGQGSTFTLYLPINRPKGSEADAPQPVSVSPTAARLPAESAAAISPRAARLPLPPKPTSSLSDGRESVKKGDKVLLVIEDDANFARTLYDYAHKKDFKCLVAVDGESGLKLAQSQPPDAVLLDLKLPGMSGWEVLNALKQDANLRHIPVHILSAAEETLDAYKRGALGFLSKPVTQEGLDGVFVKIGDFLARSIRTLLIVEDDNNLRQSVRQLLGGSDVKISEAASGSAAIQTLQEQHFDCMILDLTLPDMSGFELLNRINQAENVSKCPVIVYTGKALTEAENEELLKYANSVIIKGVKSPERLLDETALFLHRVVADMPEEKQNTIRRLHDRDAVFSGKHILVVDDDMRNAFALSRLLSDKSLKVSIARSGLKAIEMLDSTPDIDLVLMDIMMPEMDGYEAMQKIRAKHKYKNLPILALTAKAMKGDLEKCIAAGANDYLSKPIDTDRLFSMLRVWLYR